MTAKALMLQGTGSDVGKSTLTAGLCRIARRRGLSVAPFKPQNMSNNAAVCKNGGEIGRAQALQAQAAKQALHTDFNPVLMKPETDRTSQIIVHGHPVATLNAADYMTRRTVLFKAVMDSFQRLSTNYDLILVEGAGSPAEINLRAGDIANMGFATAAGVPVCLIGDIEKGGVIASLVGTKTVLEPTDAAMIEGFIVNKFRGDLTLFEEGVRQIKQRTGWPCFGVIPWLPAVARLPAEDAVPVSATKKTNRSALKIVAPMLSRLANFDDADPLKQEQGVDFQWVSPGQNLPHNADIIILFGTKSTLGDLAFLRAQGWDHDIIAHARSGGRVLGLCGGFQMLGRRISDPDGIDGIPGEAQGLGLLNIETLMSKEKTVGLVQGTCALSGKVVSGYEIHAGHTHGADLARPMLNLSSGPQGARNTSGRIEGCYVHGLFSSDPYRRNWLIRTGAQTDYNFNYTACVETAIEALADHLEATLDTDAIFACARTPKQNTTELRTSSLSQKWMY